MKIGIQELLVVFIVALIVVGPDKLPYYAKKLGEALGQFRKYTDEATKDIRESIVEPLEEAQRPLREAMEPFNELEKSVNDNVKDIQKSLNSIGKPRKDDKVSPDAASQEKDAATEPIPENGQATAEVSADSAEATAADTAFETASDTVTEEQSEADIAKQAI